MIRALSSSACSSLTDHGVKLCPATGDAARTVQHAPGARRTALFDFDGVLLRGDASALFVRARLRRACWRLLLGLVLALPMLPTLPFTRRWVVRAFVSATLACQSARRYQGLAREFGAELARQLRRFHRDALTRLRQHQAAGDRVLVVTGCEEHLARGIFDTLGLADVEILASRLKPGLLGMRVALHNIGRRKLESLRAHGVESQWDIAYGDSLYDVPMLRQAREAVLVNASPEGCKRVEQMLGRSVTRVHWY